MSVSQPEPTNQEPAAPSLEQLEKDAARYRKVRAMHASDLESYAWGAENADEFDKMIDDHE